MSVVSQLRSGPDGLLLVVGDGGHAHEVRELAHRHLRHDDVRLVPRDREAEILGAHSGPVALGIGYPAIRRLVHQRWISRAELTWPTLSHPSAEVASTSGVGEGCVLTHGAYVSTDSVIGFGVLLNWNCSVGHDTVVGDYCVINPGATVAGHVELGPGVLVGTGANVLEGRTVGAGAIIGAGAVVTHDVPAGTTVVGVPARPMSGVRAD